MKSAKAQSFYPNFTAENETTFQYDEQLPHLPVPHLNKTLIRYLDSVRPFANDEEYAETERLVNEFKHGIGASLQFALQQKARKTPNWLEKWWEDYAYLMTRQPLIPCSNFSGSVRVDPEVDWDSNELDQATKAAWMAYFMLKFWTLIRKEKLKPDNSRGQHWSMSQYRRLFSTFRIPGETCDTLVFNFRTEKQGPPVSNYLIVLCRGHIFKVPVLDSNNEQFTMPELEKQMRYVLNHSVGQGQNVPGLTCDERTSWAKNRNYLIDLHPNNKKALNTIETAISFFVLDEHSPSNEMEFVTEGMGGDIRNRWADSFNHVVFKNGDAIGNADHTPYDGIVAAVYDFYQYVNFQKTQGKWEGTQHVRNIPVPEEITFHLDNYMKNAIVTAIQTSQDLIDKAAILRFTYKTYGKQFLTSNKMNPDTYLQESLQLAYYRAHNKPAATYETATTRAYYNGRTETVRSCTMEVIEWAKSMLDSSESKEKRLQLLKRATVKHERLMAEGKRNEGCDRHLTGLYILCYETGQEIPGIFTDPNWFRSGGNGNFILSTSLNGYMPTVGSVAAMCEDGYGIFYSILPNQVNFVLTSWKTSKETDINLIQSAIVKSLDEMQKLFVNSSL